LCGFKKFSLFGETQTSDRGTKRLDKHFHSGVIAMPWFGHPVPHGTPVDYFAGALGATAALLLVGGAILLRWQRNRQQFILMQSALEKGITSFPGQPPFWLLSLRQGITTITLGIALIIVGSGAWAIGHGVEQPTAALANEPPPPPPAQPEGPPEGPPEEHRPPPPRNPIIEKWQRAQMEQTLGQVAMGCGVILLLLGIARTGFARTERRYANTPGTPS
jgi:hypothetical protein